CHSHYFTLSVPLVMGLLASCYETGRAGWFFWVGAGACAVVFGGTTLALLPGLETVRDLGLVLYVQLGLWLLGWLVRWRPPAATPTAAQRPAAPASAA